MRPTYWRRSSWFAQQFVAADGYALWRRQNDEGLWHAMVLSGLSPAFDAVSWETGQRRPMAEEAIAYEDVFGTNCFLYAGRVTALKASDLC